MPKINFKNFFSKNPKIKYAAAKQAIILAEENPKSLYGDIDFFIELLDSQNNIMKWTGIKVLGSLSAVDRKNKINKLWPKFLKMLKANKMITAANTTNALGQIAKNKLAIRQKILTELIKIEKYCYETPECKNVVLGDVCKALAMFADEIKGKKIFFDFIRRQTKNNRASVKKTALEIYNKLK